MVVNSEIKGRAEIPATLNTKCIGSGNGIWGISRRYFVTAITGICTSFDYTHL